MRTLGVESHTAAHTAQLKAEIITKTDAKTFVNVSKEFIHTYVQTGRKLPLGAREDMDVSLEYRTVPERDTGYPRKIGVDAQGKDIYEITSSKIPAHGGIKASSPCPPWIKE